MQKRQKVKADQMLDNGGTCVNH